MAQRASRLRVKVLLWKQIENLPVDGQTVVADYIAPHWMPRDATESCEHKEDGSCATTVTIELPRLWEEIERVYPKKIPRQVHLQEGE